MNKKLIGIVAVIIMVAGCGVKSPAEIETDKKNEIKQQVTRIAEVEYKLKDGRTVTCLIWDADAGYDSGMSCDWMSAIPKDDS